MGREGGEEEAHLGLLALEDELRIQAVVDLLEILRRTAWKYSPRVTSAIALQRLFVEPDVDRPSLEADRSAFDRPEPDRENLHAALRGHPRGVERIGAGRSPPIAQQDDDAGGVRAGRGGLDVLFLPEDSPASASGRGARR